jgi:hypothetical protein
MVRSAATPRVSNHAATKCANQTEQLFRILFGFFRNVASTAKFNLCTNEEDNMKKLGYVIAAVATIAIAAPSIASAETVVVRHGDHHHFGAARAEMHRDRGWHHHHDRVVIVKHRHHDY